MQAVINVLRLNKGFKIMKKNLVTRVEDAGDLVRLYHIIHPDCDSVKKKTSETNSLALVKVRIPSSCTS